MDQRRGGPALSYKRMKNCSFGDTEHDDTADYEQKQTLAAAVVYSSKPSVGGERDVTHNSSLSPPLCQADKCSANFLEARRYYRRHKVCELHSKAAVVLVGGLRQRFCQQCSRFHELVEFDDTKRSCRRRLAGHNERRRKASSSDSIADGSSREGGSPELENYWRQMERSDRIHVGVSGNVNFRHFQIR